jgi:hypothetical protein
VVGIPARNPNLYQPVLHSTVPHSLIAAPPPALNSHSPAAVFRRSNNRPGPHIYFAFSIVAQP